MTQVVLITGASKGIGLEIARSLQSYHVIGTSRNPAASKPTDSFTLLPLDVTSSESVHHLIDQVMHSVGRIDVLINNAGYDLYGAVEETTFTDMAAQMDTNFYGAVRMTQAVLPIMRQQGGGKIINMSSIGGLLALPYNSAYAASKFALEGYSEALRYEVLRFNIYVSLVEPGSAKTDTLDTSILEVQHGLPAYQDSRAAMTRQMRVAGANSPITSAVIAQTVLHILREERPRLRYPIGGLARWMPLLKRVLPQRTFEGFIMRQFMR
jgi:short-subunit dehydrogenase